MGISFSFWVTSHSPKASENDRGRTLRQDGRRIDGKEDMKAIGQRSMKTRRQNIVEKLRSRLRHLLRQSETKI